MQCKYEAEQELKYGNDEGGFDYETADKAGFSGLNPSEMTDEQIDTVERVSQGR